MDAILDELEAEKLLYPLRPFQRQAIKCVSNKNNCLIVQPTGYGRSIVIKMLPYLMDKVSPLFKA